VKQAAQQQQVQLQQEQSQALLQPQQQVWAQLPPRASGPKQQQQQSSLPQLPPRAPEAKQQQRQQQPLQPAGLNFLTAQQLVHKTQQALQEEAAAAGLGKRKAAGIAAGIAAYNSSSWRGRLEQGGSLGGVVGVSGVGLLLHKQ
jgi:hypothetical protein